jgi:phosphoglycerate dehydrogenase-like enzyme
MQVLLVTRRLPEAIEALAAHEFDARLTPSDVAIPDLLARADGADAILCCPGDVLDAKAIAALPASVKVIGTFSVGYDHIDVAAARARGIKLCNTPDVLSVATAECSMLLLLAGGVARRRRRAAGAIGEMARLGTNSVARHAGLRVPVGHPWYGPHRTGDCPDGAGLRDGGSLSRHGAPAAGSGAGRNLS